MQLAFLVRDHLGEIEAHREAVQASRTAADSVGTTVS